MTRSWSNIGGKRCMARRLPESEGGGQAGSKGRGWSGDSRAERRWASWVPRGRASSLPPWLASRGGDRGRCSWSRFFATELDSDAHKGGGAQTMEIAVRHWLSTSCFHRVQRPHCFARRGRCIPEGRAEGQKKPLGKTCPSSGPLIFKNLEEQAIKMSNSWVFYGEESALAKGCWKHEAVCALPACGHWPIPDSRVWGLIPPQVPVRPWISWGRGLNTDSRDARPQCLWAALGPQTCPCSSGLWVGIGKGCRPASCTLRGGDRGALGDVEKLYSHLC